MKSKYLLTSVAVLAVCILARPAVAQQVRPTATIHADLLAKPEAIPVVHAPPIDLQAVAREDVERERLALPYRFAIPNRVFVTPEDNGTWESIGENTLVWRLRVSSPGAVSLNLGFGRFQMPEAGHMLIYAADHSHLLRPVTAEDNAGHAEFWSPVVPSDEVVVEVTLPPSARDELDLELTSVNVGYRGFGRVQFEKAGSCNIDVICPEGDAWRDEIPSVAVYSRGGGLVCTGFMVNNTAEDQTPYFLTANHCGVTSGNAASVVVYWDYESPTCGQQGGGSLDQWQSGSYWRAAYSPSDFTLVELDEDPNSAWGIAFAGWDRSNADPNGAVAIHHPSCDEKSISFEYDPCTTTSYLGTSNPGDGTHIRVIDWDAGTTEPGSSGSPLFDQNHHAVGQLHGGYAACGNDLSDWYGRFSVSWDGGGSSSSRLRDWLDPGNTGAMSLDTLVQGCGNGICDPGEDCITCPNDCIGGGCGCGNSVCELGLGEGEDCYACPEDCNSKLKGNPKNQFCCGFDLNCDDDRCSSEGYDCTPGQVPEYCCGDAVCEGPENSCNCAVDCGQPDPYELPFFTCDDGLDNDCDGGADCDDPHGECDSDPYCQCLPVGSPCAEDSECCSNKCKGGPGNKTCK